MYVGEPNAVRSWTARHGSAVRQLVSAHAEFVDAVSDFPGASDVPATPTAPKDDRIDAAAGRLLEEARAVAALPPIPDEQARELVQRLVRELQATIDAGTSDTAVLRALALRSSMVVVDLIDRLLAAEGG
jgi:hypothetical protein